MPATKYDVAKGLDVGLEAAPAFPSPETYKLRDDDGFDLFWSQKYLGDQMKSIEAEIKAIELNSNLSDTERMFAMQTAMNTWTAISNLRTNILKGVSDTLKQIVRNVN